MINDIDTLTALGRYFGFDRFLPGQQEVVERILSGEDVCVIMPTGAGKSLCFQLPILMRPGYGLVVSPLISLMKDQVDALKARGIGAACVNSMIPQAERDAAMAGVVDGAVKLLYVAPERFKSEEFRQFAVRHKPSIIVIDEVHCLSFWGHQFRVEYLRLGDAAAMLGAPQICAFTATATPSVREDILRHLRRPAMKCLVRGFQRPNLSFHSLLVRSDKHRFEELGAMLGDKKPTIIYCSTRKNVDEVAEAFGCLSYHAGMTDEERVAAQNHFMNDEIPVLAATNAFGMGIDRSDIRRIIHFNMPGSIEAYYQEAGRGGRDGDSCDCHLLFSRKDRMTHEFLIDMNNPPLPVLQEIYTALRLESFSSGGELVDISNEDLLKRVPSVRGDRQLSTGKKILERLGVIERIYSRDGRGLLSMAGDPSTVAAAHASESTQRSRLLKRVAEQYGGRLTSGVLCSFVELSEVAGLSVEQVDRVVHALNGHQLAWTPPQRGGRIRIVDSRVATLEVDVTSLDQKRSLDLTRLAEMEEYAESRSGCRQAKLVSYFGQEVSGWKCGCCDNCGKSGTKVGKEDAAIVKKVLEAVNEFGGRFGRGRIAQVLRGDVNADIVGWRLDSHPMFGRLPGVSHNLLLAIMDALKDAKCVESSGNSKYPKIAITAFGGLCLEGKEHLSMRDFREAAGEPPPRDTVSRTPLRPSRMPRGALLTRLHELCEEIAEQRRVESYRIFPHETLVLLAKRKPRSLEEARGIKGIGDYKLHSLVPKFIETINEWIKEDV